MSESRVTFEQREHVRIVRLNRPDKLNALGTDMFDALIATGDERAGDRSVHAVVLRGEGRAFSGASTSPATDSVL